MVTAAAFFRSPIARASGLRIVAMALGVVAGIIVARLGGADVKGVSAAFVASTSVLSVIIGFDLGHQTLSAARAVGDMAYVRPLLSRVTALYLVLGSAVAVLVMPFFFEAGPLIVGTIAVALSAHFAVAATGVRGATVAAVGAVVQQGVSAVGALLLGLAGLLTVELVPYLVIASALAPLVLYALALRARLEPRRKLARRALRDLIGLGALWQLARLPQILLLRLDVLVVFGVLGASAAGVYSVGLALAMLATLVPSQFAARALHRASAGIAPEVGRESLNAMLAGVVTCAGLAAVGYHAILLLYGSEFSGAYGVLLASLPGVIAYGVMQVQTNFIRLLGTGKNLLASNSIGLVAMVISLVVLVPTIGLVGAALSFSLGCVTVAGVTVLRHKKYFERPA